MKKKLFISCPMRGRTEENIKKSMEKMHKLAEILFDQELEVIDSYIPDAASADTKNRRIWYLGESIKMLSKADYFIGIHYSFGEYMGCDIERDVAQEYGIPCKSIELHDLMSDELEKVVISE